MVYIEYLKMLGHIIQKHTVCDQFVKDMDAFVSWKNIKNSKETPSMILVKLAIKTVMETLCHSINNFHFQRFSLRGNFDLPCCSGWIKISGIKVSNWILICFEPCLTSSWTARFLWNFLIYGKNAEVAVLCSSEKSSRKSLECKINYLIVFHWIGL